MLPSGAMSLRSEAPASFRSSAMRPGALTLIRTGFAEIASRRRLISYLVGADARKKGSDTLLGNVWWVVDPLLQMLIYVILVSVIFTRSQPDYPLFIFCAILPWKWFTTVVSDGVSSVTSMERLIKQINFPKLVLPVSSVMAGIVSFAFGLIPLAALIVLFYAERASPWLLAIPIIAFVQLLFSLPVAITLGATNVFYRDVGNLSRHLLRIWFYLSPGIYGTDLIDKVSEKSHLLGTLMRANPFAVLFTAYRDVIYDGRAPDWSALAILAVISIGLLAASILLFKRLEPSFAKVL
jgi:ABC-type polysaccharide/polyol phosphate export permease